MRAGRIKYHMNISIVVSGDELLEATGGDMFNITPRTATDLARKHISDGTSKFTIERKVGREVSNESVIQE